MVPFNGGSPLPPRRVAQILSKNPGVVIRTAPWLPELETHVHLPHHLMPEAIRSQSVVLLNNHLAAAIDLHAQVKQAHWNVRGPGFFPIHELFAKVSSQVEGFSDQLAERAGSLGGTALGTVQVAAKQTFFAPYSLPKSQRRDYAHRRCRALAPFGRSVQKASAQATALGDPETADFSNRSRAQWTWSDVLSTPISPHYQQRHGCPAASEKRCCCLEIVVGQLSSE